MSLVDISLGSSAVGVTFSLLGFPSDQTQGKLNVYQGADCEGPSAFDRSLGPSPWEVFFWKSNAHGQAAGFAVVDCGLNTAALIGHAVAVYAHGGVAACGVFTSGSMSDAGTSGDSSTIWFTVVIVTLCVFIVMCALGGVWLCLFRKPTFLRPPPHMLELSDMSMDRTDPSARSSGSSGRSSGRSSGSGGDDSRRVRTSGHVVLQQSDNMLDSCEGVRLESGESCEGVILDDCDGVMVVDQTTSSLGVREHKAERTQVRMIPHSSSAARSR
eukprot:TRINITY_DN10796_c0_g1_i4.p1 TRINITY_DN10796_c0_g1~~TRINITY_DN10796_c0_g1_i4.p1  ORF type:complete len:271 (+),score=18.48 TRINITY_DN10796_c0_g1_i4:258-1070(+)